MGNVNEKLIEFHDLEVGKLYKVYDVSFFKGQHNNCVDSYIKMKIEGGYVVVIERHFPEIRSFPHTTQWYLKCSSKQFLPEGIQYAVQFYIDDDDDDDAGRATTTTPSTSK